MLATGHFALILLGRSSNNPPPLHHHHQQQHPQNPHHHKENTMKLGDKPAVFLQGQESHCVLLLSIMCTPVFLYLEQFH